MIVLGNKFDQKWNNSDFMECASPLNTDGIPSDISVKNMIITIDL